MTLNKSICDFASVPLPQKKITNYYNLLIRLQVVLKLNSATLILMGQIIATYKKLIEIQICNPAKLRSWF